MFWFRRKKKFIEIELVRVDTRFNTIEKYLLHQEKFGDQVILSVQKTEGVGNEVSFLCTARETDRR